LGFSFSLSHNSIGKAYVSWSSLQRAGNENDFWINLVERLRGIPGVTVAGTPAAPFVLLRLPEAARIRLRLRDLGYAVRRADTFPGLGPDWLRIAVRDRRTTDGFTRALANATAAATT